MDSYEEWRQKHDEDAANNYRAFAEQRDRIRRDYAGQWVAFACGRVIAAGPDDEQVAAALHQLEPQPLSGCVVRAEDDPVFEVVESARAGRPARTAATFWTSPSARCPAG
jgi:hypothetical protein